MAAIGWYGPLINLSAAPSHVDDYVQLLVFVHRSTPVQYKLAKGGTVIRADIHVGDETRPFFSVSLWNKHLASLISAGDIVLLQSVDELMGSCRVGGTAKEKLRRVIEWVQQTRVTLCNELKSNNGSAFRNWKVHEEQISRTCYFLSEVLRVATPCKAIFHASIGEIFLPAAWHDSEKERMFISRRLTNRIDTIVEDMICTGCQVCGSPLSSDSSTSEQKTGALYCKKSSNRLHSVGLVYRPFMLYVWDNSDYIPLFVTNKAAELLFGDIKAEKAYESYREQKNHQSLRNLFKAASASVHELRTNEKEAMESSSAGSIRSEMRENCRTIKSPNFFVIWLILLKMLLIQGKNSPLKFEVLVTPSLEMGDGRFELICVSMPYLNGHMFPET